MSRLQACSNIYFTMDSLNQIHFLYQYSLKFFLDIFSSVLYSNPKLGSVTDCGARLAIITRDLFGVSKSRCLVYLYKELQITWIAGCVKYIYVWDLWFSDQWGMRLWSSVIFMCCILLCRNIQFYLHISVNTTICESNTNDLLILRSCMKCTTCFDP
jgi:hypothetical protein